LRKESLLFLSLFEDQIIIVCKFKKPIVTYSFFSALYKFKKREKFLNLWKCAIPCLTCFNVVAKLHKYTKKKNICTLSMKSAWYANWFHAFDIKFYILILFASRICKRYYDAFRKYSFLEQYRCHSIHFLWLEHTFK